jgi:hypothetical protein
VTGIAEHPTADWGLVLEEREHSETGGISKFHFSAFFSIFQHLDHLGCNSCGEVPPVKCHKLNHLESRFHCELQVKFSYVFKGPWWSMCMCDYKKLTTRMQDDVNALVPRVDLVIANLLPHSWIVSFQHTRGHVCAVWCYWPTPHHSLGTMVFWCILLGVVWCILFEVSSFNTFNNQQRCDNLIRRLGSSYTGVARWPVIEQI